ncbi:MAG: hypothetical protein KBS59_03205 [Clostridiales bacterium]|nr:hypothetical protein [Clostridiales bacterium]
MAEYNDLKEKLESSIAYTFYPSDIKDKNILNNPELSFLNLDAAVTRQNESDTNRYTYRDMINKAKRIIDADFTSVYYKKDVDDYMEEKKAQIEHNYAILSDEPVSEEIQNVNPQNEEIKEDNKVQIEVNDKNKEEINPDMVPVQNNNQEQLVENVKNT